MTNSKEIKIFTFGSDDGFFEKMFDNNENNDSKNEKEYGTIIIKKLKCLKESSDIFKKMKPSYIGYKYPELNASNVKTIIFDVFNDIKNSQNKRNIIIKFGNSFIKEFSILINKLEVDKPFILFNLDEIIDNPQSLFTNFKAPQYITYNLTSPNMDKNKFYCKIVSYVIEKTCYYNEIGNQYIKRSPYNLFYQEPKGFLYYNILLIGESRAGKSSFINRIFRKLLSYESSKYESTTLEIKSYELYPQEEVFEKEFKLKQGFGGIKFYDTPGLVATDNLNSNVKDKLEKIIDKIHIIYFFLKAQSNLEQCIMMLKYINNINKDREGDKKCKIPIIFVKNGEDLGITNEKPIVFQELKKQLKKHNMMGLYDNSVNNKKKEENYTEDNFFEDEEISSNKYENYIDGNIIQVHIPTGKNLDKIFATTLEYLMRNNNDLLNSDFFSIKNDAKKLISFYIKNKLDNKSLTNEENSQYKELYNKCNTVVSDFKKKNSILYNLNVLEIKSKSLKILGIVGMIVTAPLCVFVLPLIAFIPFIILADSQIINNIAITYGFGEQDIYDYKLNKYLYEKIKSENLDEKKKTEKIQKLCSSLFENLIYYIGPIQCLIKAREQTEQIKNLLESLSLRDEYNWITFNVEKI